MTDGTKDNGKGNGRVVRVIGPVVDVEFAPDALPELNTALRIDRTLGGKTDTVGKHGAANI